MKKNYTFFLKDRKTTERSQCFLILDGILNHFYDNNNSKFQTIYGTLLHKESKTADASYTNWTLNTTLNIENTSLSGYNTLTWKLENANNDNYLYTRGLIILEKTNE